MGVAWALFTLTFNGLDPDFFWHVRTGVLRLAGERPDLADPYSWTAAGRFWLDHEWLGEEAWAWVLDRTGMGGLLMLHRLALVAMWAVLMGVARLAGSRWGAAALLALGAMLLLEPWYLARLQLVTGFGLAFTVGGLVAWQAGKARAWWALPYAAGVGLWANLHGGGAIAGPLSLTLALGAELVAPRETRPKLRPLVAATVAGWAALFCNPMGPGLPAFAVATLVDPNLRAMNAIINEWHSFNPAKPLADLYLAWTAALAALVLLVRPRVSPGLGVVALAWLVMGFVAYRNIPLGAIATLPVLAIAMANSGKRAAIAASGLYALAALLVHPNVGIFGGGATRQALPSSPALAALKQDAASHHLLNFYNWGGEIILVSPEAKVFIDGRQYLYGLQTNLDYVRLASAAPGYPALLKQRGIDRVCFPPHAPLVMALRQDPTWHVQFEDTSAVILTRQ